MAVNTAIRPVTYIWVFMECLKWSAIIGDSGSFSVDKEVSISRHFYKGWMTGFEPATAWTTTRSSTS